MVNRRQATAPDLADAGIVTRRARSLRLVSDEPGAPDWRDDYRDRSLRDVCRVILEAEPRPTV